MTAVGLSRSQPWRRRLDGMLSGLSGAVVVFAFLFLLVPLGITGLMAFDSRSYLGPLPPPSFSLQWFEHFLSDAYLMQGLQTSLLVSATAVLIAAAAGVATALFLNRLGPRWSELLTAFFVSPLIVPPVVIGFALLLFLSQIGIVEGFVRLVCGHLILTIPYTIRATLASLAGVDKTLLEAASGLGANERQVFWEITFPLARTGIIAGAIFAFAISMDDVAVSMFLTDATTYTLPVALVSNMRANFDLTIAAASMLLVLFTILLIAILDRLVGVDRVMGQGLHPA